MRKRPKSIRTFVKTGVLALVLTSGLVSGTATAGPGDKGELKLLNHNAASYCWDISPTDGTNCGGWLKVFTIVLLP